MAFPLTEQDFLDLWERVLDPSYTQPMKLVGDGSGLEIFQAHAAIMARASQAVDVTTEAMFILPFSGQTNPPASGPVRATVSLSITRTKEFQFALTFKAGFVLVEDEVGRQSVLTEDAVFAAGDMGPVVVAAQATRPGYSWNVRAGTLVEFSQPGVSFANTGATVDASGTKLTDTGTEDQFLPVHVGQHLQFTAGVNVGEVRRISQWQRNIDGTNTVTLEDGAALTPEAGTAGWRILRWLADLGVSVTNPDPASGGRTGMLDALGAERRISRQAGEDDDPYRLRIATLPDVVSPNAIIRAANRVLAPLGITICFREVETPEFPGFFFDQDAFDYDDVAQPLVRFKLLLSDAESRAFFLIGVPSRSDGEFGFAYDEGFVNAYDASPDPDFYDGFPSVWWGTYVAAIWSQVDAIRAAGVGFDIYRIKLDDPSC